MGKNLRNINYILKPSVVISLSAFLVSCGGGGGGGGGSSQPSSTDIYIPPTNRVLPSPPPMKNLGNGKEDQQDNIKLLPKTDLLKKMNLNNENINRDQLKDKENDENNHKTISIIDSGFNNYPLSERVKKANSNTRYQTAHGVYVTDIIKDNTKQNQIYIIDAGSGGLNLSLIPDYFDTMYKKGARIFNNSYGKTENINLNQYRLNTLEYYINNKPETDSIFVFAAGNESKNYTSIEASYPIVNDNARNGFIAVAAYDEKDKSKLASYSNRFDEKSKKWGIAASGITKNNQGTSFAAPRVTATVANVWNQFPWMSNHLVTVTILSTADKPGKPGTPTEGPNSGQKEQGNPEFGWGILNQERALRGPALLHLDLRTLSKDEQFVQNLFTVDFDYRNYQDKDKLTWSNDIKGDGGIYKKGTGILYLSGDNQYKGSTWIQNGEIVLQNKLKNSYVIIEKQGTLRAESKNGTLVEIGKSITNNGGSLNVYGKGLYIKEKYEGKNGARIVIDIDKSLLKASGSVDFGTNGYLLADVQKPNEIPSKDLKQRTIIEANKIENFDSNRAKISTDISLFINIYGLNLKDQNKKLDAQYSRNDAPIVAKALGFQSNDIAFKTAKNLDVVLDELAESGNKNSEIYQASLMMFEMPKPVLAKSINTLSGEIYSSSQNILAKQNETFSKTLSNRLSSLIYEDRSGFWANQIFADVNLKNKGYANTSTNIHGLAFGIDKKTDNYILGVSFLSGRAKTDFDKNAGSTNIKNTSVSLYGSYNFDDFYMLGRVGLNSSKSKVEREILDKNSKISYDSKFYNTYTEIGKIFELDKFKINPFFATQLDWLQRDKISEKDVFGLQADKKTYNLTSLLAGVRTKVEFDKLFISSNLTYINKLSPNDFSFDAKFTGSNSNVKITGIKEAKSTIWFGSNFGYNLTKDIMLNCGFDLSFDSSHNNSKVFNVGGLYRF
ncbi:putative autotransporter serine protease [Campylobacter pinnipediorum subsp. caledonicus]|uniref:Putative autotransporter serine protease n=1 Tax=Campylobacter pinnipediorum subsp. caledonicus TaxID=1874362 RepID=A0A1S6U7T1_9BACT|nr:autotransporter domain-containing protein [Campylobacter pinnipediorum]AQW87732.1 putative autotransporter serine protease [Campylobacter pinnipediorum subsp. caledonicus]